MVQFYHLAEMYVPTSNSLQFKSIIVIFDPKGSYDALRTDLDPL